MQRFAEFNPAARLRIKALGGGPRAAHQQNPIVAKDRAADGKLGPGRRYNRRHDGQWVMM
jgi:hypothetical protein